MYLYGTQILLHSNKAGFLKERVLSPSLYKNICNLIGLTLSIPAGHTILVCPKFRF